MPRLLRLGALLLALAASGAVEAQTYASGRGSVAFTSSVPLHTFTGTSEHLNAQLDVGTGEVDVYVDLATLDTGIGKRDRDMRETLETDRFPFAEFTGRLLTPLDVTDRSPQLARVRGTFSLHGVDRTRVVEGTIEPTARGLRLRAAWEVRLDAHDIEPPRLLGVKVSQAQAIEIDVLLVRS